MSLQLMRKYAMDVEVFFFFFFFTCFNPVIKVDIEQYIEAVDRLQSE